MAYAICWIHGCGYKTFVAPDATEASESYAYGLMQPASCNVTPALADVAQTWIEEIAQPITHHVDRQYGDHDR